MFIEEGINDRFFKIDKVPYNKGQWTVIYSNNVMNDDGSVNESLLKIGIRSKYDVNTVIAQPEVLSSWSDSTNTPYTDLSVFLNDLHNYIDLT